MYTLHVPPAARTRCKAVSNQGRAQRDSRNTKWIEAERDQAKPVWIDSSTSDGVGTELSTVLALPRCISIRPSLVSTAGTLSESERWLNHYNAALNLHLATGTIRSSILCSVSLSTFFSSVQSDSHGTKELWYQLKGTPDLPEERPQGSPNSPHFSAIRLQLVQEDSAPRSVIIVFCITPNGDGTFRPWKKGVSNLISISDGSDELFILGIPVGSRSPASESHRTTSLESSCS